MAKETQCARDIWVGQCRKELRPLVPKKLSRLSKYAKKSIARSLNTRIQRHPAENLWVNDELLVGRGARFLFVALCSPTLGMYEHNDTAHRRAEGLAICAPLLQYCTPGIFST